MEKIFTPTKILAWKIFFQVIGFLVFLVKTINDDQINLQDPFIINYY